MQRVSQRERILALLTSHEGEWIAAFRLAVISLRYGSCIYELRKLGHQIEIEQKIVNGQWHSAYRLMRVPETTPEPLDALLESWYKRIEGDDFVG